MKIKTINASLLNLSQNSSQHFLGEGVGGSRQLKCLPENFMKCYASHEMFDMLSFKFGAMRLVIYSYQFVQCKRKESWGKFKVMFVYVKVFVPQRLTVKIYPS